MTVSQQTTALLSCGTAMPAPDFRALCAELVETWDATGDFDFNDFGNASADIVTRARAALAAGPVGEGPTDEEIGSLADVCWDEPMDRVDVWKFARAVLARWGQPTPQPIPVSERLPGEEDANTAEIGLDALRNTVCNSLDDYNAIFAALKRLAEIAARPAEPADLSHLSDKQFFDLCPQGYHAP